ncbi:ATP-binding protein [Streptomyces sp. NPDC048568]|uniref:ATP-binding protein n=1 Tax=Streptomyces sp. NPDC048568 TaxID=3365571 RepID=UPI00371AF848
MTSRTLQAGDGMGVCTETLPRRAESAATGRRIVRAALRGWELGDLVDTAELVVTELIANAVQHARYGVVRLTVRCTEDGGVHVAVTDRSHQVPVLRQPGPAAQTGRGLAIVDSLAARWGHDPLPWGKRVWAELRGPS